MKYKVFDILLEKEHPDIIVDLNYNFYIKDRCTTALYPIRDIYDMNDDFYEELEEIYLDEFLYTLQDSFKKDPSKYFKIEITK